MLPLTLLADANTVVANSCSSSMRVEDECVEPEEDECVEPETAAGFTLLLILSSTFSTSCLSHPPLHINTH